MVEIKLDLKRNSKEDIKKVIEFLQKFIEEEVSAPDISPGAFNLFSSPEPSSPSILPKVDESTMKDIDDNDDDDDDDDPSDLEIKPIFY